MYARELVTPAGVRCYNTDMKTFLLCVLGLFLLGMAAVTFQGAMQHHGDWIELGIAVGFTAGGVKALRAGGKRMEQRKAPGRKAGGPGL
ncbi:hypothetical protein [Streptomyces phage phiScoe1]|nr:hypothetical protein [Streptomyces phage phiScoe1]